MAPVCATRGPRLPPPRPHLIYCISAVTLLCLCNKEFSGFRSISLCGWCFRPRPPHHPGGHWVCWAPHAPHVPDSSASPGGQGWHLVLLGSGSRGRTGAGTSGACVSGRPRLGGGQTGGGRPAPFLDGGGVPKAPTCPGQSPRQQTQPPVPGWLCWLGSKGSLQRLGETGPAWGRGQSN